MSESFFIWAITGLLIAVIVIPYWYKSLVRDRAARVEKIEAAELGIDKPKAQYPMVDMSACIGCGSCIRACPEGGVLGLVAGKATIINGFRCVGHGKCAEACPVEAVTVGLGDLASRSDIPILDDAFESSVPNVHVIGELGGLALIRNAIKQGEACVAAIAKKPRSSDTPIPDVAIIGAGPAGMSAALTAKREGLSYLLLDQQELGGTILQYPRKKLVLTQPVDIPLYGRLEKDEYEKEQLLEIWRKAVHDNEITVTVGPRLESVEETVNGLRITTTLGPHLAHHVVLALGRRGSPRKLGVPGEDQAKVMYQLIDAIQYQNNHVLVVGGGDSAIEAAMALAQQSGNTVTLSYRKTKFFRIKKRNEERLRAKVEAGAVRVLYSSTVTEIMPHEVVIDKQGHIERIPNDYVFVFAGGIPPFKLLKDIGIRFGGEQQPKREANGA